MPSTFSEQEVSSALVKVCASAEKWGDSQLGSRTEGTEGTAMDHIQGLVEMRIISFGRMRTSRSNDYLPRVSSLTSVVLTRGIVFVAGGSLKKKKKEGEEVWSTIAVDKVLERQQSTKELGGLTDPL